MLLPLRVVAEGRRESLVPCCCDIVVSVRLDSAFALVDEVCSDKVVPLFTLELDGALRVTVDGRREVLLSSCSSVFADIRFWQFLRVCYSNLLLQTVVLMEGKADSCIRDFQIDWYS